MKICYAGVLDIMNIFKKHRYINDALASSYTYMKIICNLLKVEDLLALTSGQ